MIGGLIAAFDAARRGAAVLQRTFPPARLATKPVSCPVCLETATQGVLMDGCGHGFCLTCMTDWCLASLESGRATLCPMCRGGDAAPVSA